MMLPRPASASGLRKPAIAFLLIACFMVACLTSLWVSPLYVFAPFVLVGLIYAILRWPVSVAAGILVAAPFLSLPTMGLQAAGFEWTVAASSLKEIGLFAATCVLIGKRGLRLRAPDVILFMLLLVALAVSVAKLTSLTAISLKDDFDFLIPFLAGSALPLNERWVRHGILVAGFLALLGLIEVLFIGMEPRMLLMGLSSVTEFVPSYRAESFSGFRASSLFASPLGFGAFCAVTLLLFATFYKRLSKIHFVAITFVVAGLVASLTRMAWLGATLGLMLIGFKTRQKLKFLAVLGCGAALMLAIVAPVLGLHDFLSASLKGEEQSMEGHVEALQGSCTYLADHPFGSGAGSVSRRAANPVHVAMESAYFQFGIEYGWLGLVLLVAGCAAILIRLLHNPTPFGTAAAAVAACSFTMYIFSTIHADFALSWIWVLLGYGVHQHGRRSLRELAPE